MLIWPLKNSFCSPATILRLVHTVPTICVFVKPVRVATIMLSCNGYFEWTHAFFLRVEDLWTQYTAAISSAQSVAYTNQSFLEIFLVGTPSPISRCSATLAGLVYKSIMSMMCSVVAVVLQSIYYVIMEIT